MEAMIDSASATNQCGIVLDGDEAAPLRFSIVIANFNYARFLGRSIESALEQQWPYVEVIVVDDGSTDDSRAVIESFGSRIQAIFRDNAGQRIANNIGFAQSTGDVVVFLDADDVLDPKFASEVAKVWRSGTSKVQVQMARVDALEQCLGSLVPAITHAPEPEDILGWASKTSEYPTPPGSGNAYAREFLEVFFPIGPEHDSSTDSTCLALAPFLGDVITVAKPLALYRQHGLNDSNLFADKQRFGREVARALRRQQSAERLCAEIGAPLPNKNCVRLGLHLLQLRVASLRLDPASYPIKGESRWTLLGDLARSFWIRGFEPLHRRIVLISWSILVLLMPGKLAHYLIRRRFNAG